MTLQACRELTTARSGRGAAVARLRRRCDRSRIVDRGTLQPEEPDRLANRMWSGGMIDLAASETADGIARFSWTCSDVVIQPETVSADSARIAGANARKSGLATEGL